VSELGAEALEALRRRSGIAVSEDGVFLYLGQPIANERVVALFHRGLDVREDGAVTLTVGRSWCYPEVAGVARFVRRIRADAAGGTGTLASGQELALAGATIGHAPDGRFYLWVDGMRGPARVLRDAHQALVGLLADDPDEAVTIPGELAAIPGPADPRPGNLAVMQGLRPRAGATRVDGA